MNATSATRRLAAGLSVSLLAIASLSACDRREPAEVPTPAPSGTPAPTTTPMPSTTPTSPTTPSTTGSDSAAGSSTSPMPPASAASR